MATTIEPSREHDYLYVAAGSAGLHIFDITSPDGIVQVGTVATGGTLSDVSVASQLAPPGVDDYGYLSNETLGLQVVDLNDPTSPVLLGTVAGSTGAFLLKSVAQFATYVILLGIVFCVFQTQIEQLTGINPVDATLNFLRGVGIPVSWIPGVE